MGIAEALRETCEELGLSPEAIAVAGKTSGSSARSYMTPENPTTPGGDVLIRLMRNLPPSFARRLGFEVIADQIAA